MTPVADIQPAAAIATADPHRSMSPSQAATWLDCPARWYYRYALGLPEPASAALALGRALHRTIAGALRGVGCGNTPTWEGLREMYLDIAPDEFSQVDASQDESPSATQAKGLEMLQVWFSVAMPFLQPVKIEFPVMGQIGGVHVLAVIDLITIDARVIDLKTSSRKPTGISAKHSLQLTTYAILAKLDSAALHTLTTAAQPKFYVTSTNIGPAEVQYAESVYPLIADSIATGLYPPRRDHQNCSRRFCAYWRECQDEYGGEVRA